MSAGWPMEEWPRLPTNDRRHSPARNETLAGEGNHG
jgi:hypothetical protein